LHARDLPDPADSLQPSARYDADTINVAPGQRYDVVWKEGGLRVIIDVS
jgi:hypothetical protein